MPIRLGYPVNPKSLARLDLTPRVVDYVEIAPSNQPQFQISFINGYGMFERGVAIVLWRDLLDQFIEKFDDNGIELQKTIDYIGLITISAFDLSPVPWCTHGFLGHVDSKRIGHIVFGDDIEEPEVQY